ncbi:hypothetical protein [Xanthomonas hortorum]|uniref:Signal transduction histidine kinase dimerisation/phosphoacceptor domain-containing protein n=1 Tax=Xanthomonas hortorum pv. pelargonii TaxID=453602 RepID=A0A6V7EQ91_9XANT|nr:hypothetical protein [Xanthomonas hortorum]MCE4352438.1 hypothetical protein [Xanthomonas hortorum pv. pelargonii]MCM5525647.1 hypothetical protein [Xanthomonas hortorum pv. pelargonii]MCM5535795.1 hypothetical protein [Xanthomonas hortorum pv. pelargonii]MCM5539931.1 hypothetical protein [Xanthomonas hortorum pv. pelargonii]MCM5546536.1 hypothetical protein [Xanthomonas hortorum pv. pelargonii]
MADASDGQRRELLHQLRNRLNVMGFALYALRNEASKPLETLRSAHQSAVELLNQLGEEERARQQIKDTQADTSDR